MSFPMDESITTGIEEMRAKAKKADEQAREQCRQLSAQIENLDTKANFSGPCVTCGKTPYFYEWEFALLEGHIYSWGGRRKFRLWQRCEFCLDKTTR